MQSSPNSDEKPQEQPPDLTAEEERLLDRAWKQVGREEVERLKKYAPVMAKLIDALRILDSEAVAMPNGTPVGLWWYARHRRRDEIDPKNCRNEEDWSRRIKDLFVSRHIVTECEQYYPKPPKRRCDIVMQWPGLGRIWLEVKGAWLPRDSKGNSRNPDYRKHLYAAGGDLEKVCSLDETVADHFGLLLVGFDTKTKPIPETDIDLVRDRSDRGDWIEQYCEWDDLPRKLGRVRVWLWLTEAKYVPDIFD